MCIRDSTKHGWDKLAKFLEQSGIKVAAIHGNKSQGARLRALKDFCLLYTSRCV